MMNIMILSNNKQNWFIKILFLDFFEIYQVLKRKEKETETKKKKQIKWLIKFGQKWVYF